MFDVVSINYTTCAQKEATVMSILCSSLSKEEQTASFCEVLCSYDEEKLSSSDQTAAVATSTLISAQAAIVYRLAAT